MFKKVKLLLISLLLIGAPLSNSLAQGSVHPNEEVLVTYAAMLMSELNLAQQNVLDDNSENNREHLKNVIQLSQGFSDIVQNSVDLSDLDNIDWGTLEPFEEFFEELVYDDSDRWYDVEEVDCTSEYTDECGTSIPAQLDMISNYHESL